MPNFSFREQVVHHLPAQHSFRNNGVLEEGKKEVLHLMSISIFVNSVSKFLLSQIVAQF